MVAVGIMRDNIQNLMLPLTNVLASSPVDVIGLIEVPRYIG